MIKGLGCVFFFILFFSLTPVEACANSKNYNIKIMTYERNDITVQFPKITGLENSSKQKEINYLLERTIFQYVNDLLNQGKIDKLPLGQVLQNIDNETYIEYRFTCKVTFATDEIISVYIEIRHKEPQTPHPNLWMFTYAVDINKEKVIGLEDFVSDIEHLLLIETDNLSYMKHIESLGLQSNLEYEAESFKNNSSKGWYLVENREKEVHEEDIYLVLTYWSGRFHDTYAVPLRYAKDLLETEYKNLIDG